MSCLDETEGSCKTCGLWVYTIWLDAEPPNGACPHKKDGAPAACPEVMSSMLIARSVRAAGLEPTPRNLYVEALGKKLGITDADLDAWHQKDEEDADYD